MTHCASCKSTNYLLSDCSKYIKCNSCKEIYNSKCSMCNSHDLGTINDKKGGSQICKNCGITTSIWEFIPYDKPKFNGVYNEKNGSQLLFDVLSKMK